MDSEHLLRDYLHVLLKSSAVKNYFSSLTNGRFGPTTEEGTLNVM